jgi:hypothetical protein
MLTMRAGLGTRPDQMPLATPAFTVSAGAPHFSQQQLLPTGQPAPYATATFGAYVMVSQRGWLQQAAWHAARPPADTWLPKSFPNASMAGPLMVALGHCSGAKGRATPPTQMPPTYVGSGVSGGEGAPGMVVRSTQQGAPTAQAAASPACAVGAKV